VIEGKVGGGREVTERRRKTCKQILNDLKEKRRYCKLQEEALGGELALEEAVDLS
jgi:hypothetical protein